MSHLKSFIHAPFRDDKGRRHVTQSSSYGNWDYLKDNRPESEISSHIDSVGTSNGRDSKFKVGFYRRPQAKIQQDKERVKFEQYKDAHYNATAAIRLESLQQHNSKNSHLISEPPTENKMFASRKHFPLRTKEVEELNHQRQKVGPSRFHMELTDKEKNVRQQLLAERIKSQKQFVSIVGYGRSDLPTDGVADNFRSVPYVPSDILTKPSKKPVNTGTHLKSNISFDDHVNGIAGLEQQQIQAGVQARMAASHNTNAGAPQRKRSAFGAAAAPFANTFSMERAANKEASSANKSDGGVKTTMRAAAPFRPAATMANIGM